MRLEFFTRAARWVFQMNGKRLFKKMENTIQQPTNIIDLMPYLEQIALQQLAEELKKKSEAETTEPVKSDSSECCSKSDPVPASGHPSVSPTSDS